MTYGFHEDADLRAVDVVPDGTRTHFRIPSGELGPEVAATLNLPGRHNVQNALAAVAIARSLDVDDDHVREALAAFQGIGRRFEVWDRVRIGGREVRLVDDYGHHPREIEATVAAAREAWPERRLVVAFQPHRYTRTRDLLDDFARVLSPVDALLVAAVYPAGEEPIPGADAHGLCQAVRARRGGGAGLRARDRGAGGDASRGGPPRRRADAARRRRHRNGRPRASRRPASRAGPADAQRPDGPHDHLGDRRAGGIASTRPRTSRTSPTSSPGSIPRSGPLGWASGATSWCATAGSTGWSS